MSQSRDFSRHLFSVDEKKVRELHAPPVARLQRIGFDTVTSEEILRSSVFEKYENVRGLKSLSESRLGLPNSDCKCSTCNITDARDEHQCPGHFGHSSLSIPIYNPLHIRSLVRLLNKICPACGKPKQSSGHRKLKEVLSECSKKTNGERISDCKYCMKDDDMPYYPDIKFRLVPKRLGMVDNVYTIDMNVKIHGATTLPCDFWTFIDRSTDIPEKPRLSRPLLPSEALKIVIQVAKHSSGSDIAELELTGRPDIFIIKNLFVPPNCLRFTESYKAGVTHRRHERGAMTQMLANIVSFSNSITSPYSDLHVANRDSFELQTRVSKYFGSFKIFSSEKEQPGFQRNNAVAVKQRQASKKSGPSWFKKNILGKRSHYSGIAVVTGDPNVALKQLAIPRAVAEKLKVPVRITIYNHAKIKADILDGQNKITVFRAGNRHVLSKHSQSDLQVGDVIERPLVDGDSVFVNRSPTIHMHSVIGFEAKIENRHSFGINPILCNPLGADFDGDTLHIYVPQSLGARAEVVEMFAVSRQMKSPQGGQVLLGLSQDGLLSSYLMLQQFWVEKYHMQMLNMRCDSFMPMPAIVKAPSRRGPLWTGLQVISMTLPWKIDSKYLEIHDSEVLYCTSYGKQFIEGIIRIVLDQAGPEETTLFLTRLQNVLHEWICMVGFGVGFVDFVLKNDIKSRIKLMMEVKTGLEAARDSSRKAISLFSSENYMNGRRSSVAKSGELDEVGIEAFRTVFQDIQTVVERHCSRSNSLLHMVKAGSKGSLRKLVQQCTCLGLQLLDGKRWFIPGKPAESFWEYSGIIESSFLDGLKYEEFLNHVLSKRSTPKGYGVEGPGELFRNSMFGMRELYVSYDSSVRTRTGNHVVQFCYGSTSRSNEAVQVDSHANFCDGGEAAGALAVTAVMEPAYNYSFEQSVSGTALNPIKLLKETLSRGSHSKVKNVDCRSTLRISSQVGRKQSDWARAALEIQRFLRPITLGDLPVTTMIEYNRQRTRSMHTATNHSSWLIHIHISQDELAKVNLKLEDILSVFYEQSSDPRKDRFACRKHCDFGSSNERKENSPCILVYQELSVNGNVKDIEGYDGTNFLKYYVIPSILETKLKGSQQIKIARTRWEDVDDLISNTGTGPRQQYIQGFNEGSKARGEIAIEVCTDVVSGTWPWEIVKENCWGVMDMIDWKISGPHSISEVCRSQGIEAARRLIYERLKLSVQGMGAVVHNSHLSLIADYMTHSGKVLGLTAVGMKQWNKEVNISAPFTEGAFADPKSTFLDAARKQRTEELTGLLTSLVWGTYDDGMGKNAFFDLLWSEKVSEATTEDIQHDGSKLQEKLNTMGNKEDCIHPPGFGNRMNTDSNKHAPEFGKHEELGSEQGRSPQNRREDVSELSKSAFTILHHRYHHGQYLDTGDMEFILHKILIHHPSCKAKIGCGVKAIKIGHNPKFPKQHCFVLVRHDGSCEDFSYRKCLQNISS